MTGSGGAALDVVPGAQRLEPGHDLALVVDRAARDQPLAALGRYHGRLERRGEPQLERLDRLHVVMAVVEDVRAGVAARPRVVADDHRLARGLAQRRLEADRAQALDEPLGGAPGIGVARGIGADAGDPQQLLPALDRRRAVGVEAGEDGVERQRHAGLRRQRHGVRRKVSRNAGAAAQCPALAGGGPAYLIRAAARWRRGGR